MGKLYIEVPLETTGFFFMEDRQRRNKMKKIITSESVCIGHPDKTCDTIADAFLDEALRQDRNSQMAVECAIKDEHLFVYGEATTKAQIDYDRIAREVLADVGYDATKFDITLQISKQSPDINQAVVGAHLNANDQGIVFGYACNDTPEYMPLPIMLAHKLMQKFDEFRRKNHLYRSDAKSQVSVEYDNDKVKRIDTILISVSHDKTLGIDTIKSDIMINVVAPVLAEYSQYDKGDIKMLINPSGKFTVWGSYGDSGCVGRKIVVDTYGGVGRVGGGCFSSKNATKVDRSGAYYARYIAKNIVANGLADKCEIELSFGIGLARPLSINIETFETNRVPMEKIYEYVRHNFDTSVENIINELDLLRPIYKNTACFGHFGRNEFSWEQIKKTKNN